MDYSRIPEELKNQNQWVCAWDGSKVPMRAFERKAASSTAPDTWSTFEQAEWAVENGHYDHIGYVFADQNIVGIDIDAGFEDGLIKKVQKVCALYREGLMQDGKVNPVTGIFWQKNYDGMKDQTEMVLTPNNPLGDSADTEALARKYLDNADIVDVPEGEISEVAEGAESHKIK